MRFAFLPKVAKSRDPYSPYVSFPFSSSAIVIDV